jgi:hypothetical protein
MKNGVVNYFDFKSKYDFKNKKIAPIVKVPGIIVIKNNIRDLVKIPNLFVSLKSFIFKKTCL